MTTSHFDDLFTREKLRDLFPDSRADQFFEALLGDSEEGSYDISLEFRDAGNDRLNFEFHLKQRPEKCLACNLTYGLPEVFSRHPVINITKLVGDIEGLINGKAKSDGWQLGATREISRALHVIPLTISLKT